MCNMFICLLQTRSVIDDTSSFQKMLENEHLIKDKISYFLTIPDSIKENKKSDNTFGYDEELHVC